MNNLRYLRNFAATLVVTFVFSITTAIAENRVALVIGNGKYVSANPLKNPANDATDVAKALEQRGFEVIVGTDTSYQDMRQLIQRFSKAVASADVATFYYAGHGLQVNGENYLVPIDAKLDDKNDLDFQTLPLSLIQRQMEQSASTRLLFLDACRDNPLTRSWSSTSRSTSGKGLASPSGSTKGTYIAFATEPGNVALDGSDARNSPFTAAFLNHVHSPNVELASLMKRVRRDVTIATKDKQIPWSNSGLIGDFYFNLEEVSPDTPSLQSFQQEHAAWQAIKKGKNPSAIESFLIRFPNGALSTIARDRLKFLRERSHTALLKPSRPVARNNCEIGGRVSIVGNEFPATKIIGKGAKECKGGAIKAKLTADHRKINLPGLQQNPAVYTSAITSNTSIVSLMNSDVIRPLDDLVAKYGQNLKRNQLIKINGKIMAVAFMANSQHLMYRKDVLHKIGMEAPKSYEDMLIAAKKIRKLGIMRNPVGGAYKVGWNLAQEFNNMFIGYGGEHFKAGSARPNINNEKGVAALTMMKALSEYMDPGYLTHDSNGTIDQFRAGKTALMSMWGSRGWSGIGTDGVPAAVKSGFAIAGPMTVGNSGIPAATLWWDGWTVAKNVSDADADATFIALTYATRPEILDNKTSTLAVWMIDGYQPTATAKGVFASIEADTRPYPMLPYMSLLHSALGSGLPDFMRGNKSAKQALADVETAYIAKAKTNGFLN